MSAAIQPASVRHRTHDQNEENTRFCDSASQGSEQIIEKANLEHWDANSAPELNPTRAWKIYISKVLGMS